MIVNIFDYNNIKKQNENYRSIEEQYYLYELMFTEDILENDLIFSHIENDLSINKLIRTFLLKNTCFFKSKYYILYEHTILYLLNNKCKIKDVIFNFYSLVNYLKTEKKYCITFITSDKISSNFFSFLSDFKIDFVKIVKIKTSEIKLKTILLYPCSFLKNYLVIYCPNENKEKMYFKGLLHVKYRNIPCASKIYYIDNKKYNFDFKISIYENLNIENITKFENIGGSFTLCEFPKIKYSIENVSTNIEIYMIDDLKADIKYKFIKSDNYIFIESDKPKLLIKNGFLKKLELDGDYILESKWYNYKWRNFIKNTNNIKDIEILKKINSSKVKIHNIFNTSLIINSKELNFC